jgi:DNA repair exonuclease SbcCD ATPase subunit
MDEAEQGLYDLLVERLLANESAGDDVSTLVLAAWAGDDRLTEATTGAPTSAHDPSGGRTQPPHPDVYLGAVHVEGFRGIGEPATLPLRPGPGLTLVTGRNGSGKSSFAEAAELVLTGSSGRWKGRTTVWREGWRNLHSDASTSIAVDLITTGAVGTTRIERRWEPTDSLDEGRWTRQPSGAKREAFDGTAWGEDMQTYRPFLSYSELGALIDGKPSELYDALHSLLGLGALTSTQDRLKSARKDLADRAKAVGAQRKSLRSELDGSDDPRIVRAVALLKPTAPDLSAIAELISGADEPDESSAALRAVVALQLPKPTEVRELTATIRARADDLGALAADEIRRADRVATLLRQALHDHAESGGTICPVCEQGTLDDAWRATATGRAEELEQTAAVMRKATGELSDAVAEGRALTRAVPTVLSSTLPVDTATAHVAWQDWATAGRTDGATALAQGLESTHPVVVEALTDLQERAAEELGRRDETWAPIARRLAAWLIEAERAAEESGRLAALDKAVRWLTDTAGDLRDQRLAPFAEQSQHVWQTLRQQSNVDLGPVRLDGTSTRRRVAMDVRVDGVDGGTALGVMSQGELHALGLSLFLPRATVDQSPFRFVLIDDPVQAMDPSKVDGLARVLDEVAATRQVVVLTHDDRLADAVRRLDLPATIWEVTRGEHSVVEMRRCDDPISRYLDDALAMALTADLPTDIRSELVASCCRSAVEAACHAKIRSVRLGKGHTHADVEAALANAETTNKKATLAVFDDAKRGSDLLGRIKSGAGPWAVDALQKCKKGAHHGLTGDLRPFVKDVEKLAEWIQR